MRPIAIRSGYVARGMGMLALAGALGVPSWVHGQEPAADPVAELGEVLGRPLPQRMSPEALKFREASLERRAKNVSALGDLSRALLLRGWQDGSMLNPNVARIDQKVQEDLANRFVEKVQVTLKTADAAKRIAAVVLVGEMADEARRTGTTTQVVDAMLTKLVKDLDSATKDKDQELCEAAARSLGKIGANPEGIVKPLELVLTAKQEGLAARRAAADALGNLARLAATAKPKFPGQPPDFEHEIGTYRAIVMAAGKRLVDSDPEVRRACAEAIRHCATRLPDLLPPVQYSQLPPPDQQLAPDELKEIKALLQQIEQHRRKIQPLVEALNGQAPALRKALLDSEPSVCLAAVQSLEGITNARRRLLLLPASILSRPEEKADANPDDALFEGLSKARRSLAHLLEGESTDVRIRLAALYVFEALGKDAEVAVDQLVKALSDKDSFVRWGAVRALREMAPDLADKIVPGLAKCLTDDNADVRRSAASTIQRYGPKATDAVPALCKATQHADPATRLSAVQVLAAVGKEAGKDAISSLVKTFTNKDELKEVRVEAGRALSKFGPHAPDGDTAKALRNALKDPDAHVRLAASEALLR